jgi:5'-hydroxyaverantin dehydrogenase
VLITGAASGIGLACAIQMAEAGAFVTISDIQETAGIAVARDLVAQGHRVQFVQCDVNSYAAQVSMFQRAIQFGNNQLDVVVPNAGILTEQCLFDMIPEPLPDLDSPPPPEPPSSCLAVNLHAVYNTCYLALHYFRLPRTSAMEFKPSIVLIASMAAYAGYLNSTTYSMSKFGVRGLFYGIRDRAMRSSVRINLVAPTFVDTALTRQPHVRAADGAMTSLVGYVPMERVVDAVVRLAVEQEVSGRAAGIFPWVSEDLGDDLEGAYGGMAMGRNMRQVVLMAREAMAKAEGGDVGGAGGARE